MTIAACFLSSEGVVLGADSTSTVVVRDPSDSAFTDHHYNYSQKIFEFGEDSSLGITMWGLGSLGILSYRTLIAEVADESRIACNSVEEVATLWKNRFWSEYTVYLGTIISRARELDQKGSSRNDDENNEYDYYKENFSGGFCIGGWWRDSRRPSAYTIEYEPFIDPKMEPMTLSDCNFWGCPNIIHRLIYGIDLEILVDILRNEKWTGSDEDLFNIVRERRLSRPMDLPIREAIDFVYSCIYATIKAFKFSHFKPICGGPIEIAVITTDRKFRWICHKGHDEALLEGQFARNIVRSLLGRGNLSP